MGRDRRAHYSIYDIHRHTHTAWAHTAGAHTAGAHMAGAHMARPIRLGIYPMFDYTTCCNPM